MRINSEEGFVLPNNTLFSSFNLAFHQAEGEL